VKSSSRFGRIFRSGHLAAETLPRCRRSQNSPTRPWINGLFASSFEDHYALLCNRRQLKVGSRGRVKGPQRLAHLFEHHDVQGSATSRSDTFTVFQGREAWNGTP